MGTGAQVLQNTISDMRILSSKVARKAPSAPGHLCLICPRIPETVWIFTPSNRATSIDELNMSLMNAVFLKILNGCLRVTPSSAASPTPRASASSPRGTSRSAPAPSPSPRSGTPACWPRASARPAGPCSEAPRARRKRPGSACTPACT